MLYFFIVWFFNWLYPSHFGTSLVFVPSLGPKLWAIKVGSWWKNVVLGKYKMGPTDQIVYLPKKFRKQKSSVSLTYPWNGPTFFTLDQNLRSYSKKTDFQVIGLKKFPPPQIWNFETAAAKLLDFFQFFFFVVSKYIFQGILSENFALLFKVWAILGHSV